MADPFKQALEALKGYFAPAGEGTEQYPYAPWQKTGQEAISGAVEGLKGLAGVEGPKESTANTVGLLTGAAMPFAKLGKLKGLRMINEVPTVFHGSPAEFEAFNLTKNNPHDTLGWMVHAAEDPTKAEPYTRAIYGKGLPLEVRPKPNIRPITSSSENVLDITKIPTGEEWERLQEPLARMAEHPIEDLHYKYENLPPSFNRTQAQVVLATHPDMVKNATFQRGSDMNAWLREHGIKSIKQILEDPVKMDEVQRFYLKSGPAFPGTWLRDVRAPLNDPKVLEDTGFDAIRYLDIGDPSWAFPRPEQLSTPWGVPLGELKKLKF